MQVGVGELVSSGSRDGNARGAPARARASAGSPPSSNNDGRIPRAIPQARGHHQHYWVAERPGDLAVRPLDGERPWLRETQLRELERPLPTGFRY